MVSPGSLGLNLEAESSILDPRFATEANNAVIDTAGRLAARSGYAMITTSLIAANADVLSLFEYRKGDGTSTVLLAWNGGISNDASNPAGSDISGAVTDANGNWHFQNFNDKAIGFQAGLKPIVWNGAGNFATVVEASGTAPSGGIGACVYGRVWASSTDGQTIKYSGLLDETNWGASGSGTIDMRKVWTGGTDTIRAIVGYNGLLVVFGLKHVVFWTDGGSTGIGLDPTLMYVADIITGTGALSQKAITEYGDTDLYFVSPQGVQSLSRVVRDKSNPIATLSGNVRRAIITDLIGTPVASLRSAYSPKDGVFVVAGNANRDWVLNGLYPDTTLPPTGIVTTWALTPTALLYTTTGVFYIGVAGGVAAYSGATDNGSAIAFGFKSPWLNFGEDFANRLKILKRYGAILFASSNATINFNWWVDFSDDTNTTARTIVADSSAEYGIAEYGRAEYAGGLTLRSFKLPARGEGQYYRIGISTSITGTFALQKTDLFAKLGRLA